VPRQYAVIDQLELVPTSYHPSADEAMAAGRTLATSVVASQGFAGVVEERCEDGMLLFGQVGEGDPFMMPGELVALVMVDEMGRA
jgi:hypothetical protein